MSDMYDVILADPPWRYAFSRSRSRKIENQYPTMTPDDLKALPIDEWAGKNCVLFLWATSPKLDLAMDILRAWRFQYVTCAVWAKDRIGMGYYFRQQHELLLIAKRGAVSPPPVDARPSSIISAPRTQHSRKPSEVHEIIERMYPEARRIELFARDVRPGWTVWGNEIAPLPVYCHDETVFVQTAESKTP